MNHAMDHRSRSLFLVMLAALIGLTGLLGGCTSTRPPTFSAVGVRQVAQEDGRSVIEFSIEATNPNREPIPLRLVRYRVELGGEVVFEGVRSPETTLHTYASHVFTLPAVLPDSSLKGPGEVPYSVIGSVQYIPPGRLSEVLFDAEIEVPEAVLELSGSINTGG